MMEKTISKLALAAALCARLAFANSYPEVGLHPGYTLMSLRPAGFEPEVAGMDFLPNGDMIVLTWRGTSGPSKTDPVTGMTMTGTRTGTPKLYRVTNTRGNDPGAIKATEIGSGFKDAQGLCVVDGNIYVGDIDRVVKMVDKDGDGVYETQQEIGKLPSYSGWFEYSFGPVYKDGKLYMALAGNVQMSGWPAKQFGKDRSTVVSLPIGGGTYTVVATGLRAPDGIAIGPDGEIFTTDNQGGWRPGSMFINIQPGRFYGYFADSVATPGAKISPPAIWVPYRVANDSPTEPSLVTVGPYKGQFIYGDVGRGGLYRAFFEKVGGEYQGSVISFSGGFEVGIHRTRTGPNGEIYVGGLGNGGDSNQGWNGKTFGLQKMIPTAVQVFEILATRSRAKGMELEFTMAVGASAEAIGNYTVQQWTNTPMYQYGGGEGTHMTRTIKSVQVSSDRKRVFLEIDGLQTNQVVQIATKNLMSQDNKALWYSKTWYTLNAISPSEPFEVATETKPVTKVQDMPGFNVERIAGGMRVNLPTGNGSAYRVELVDFQGKSMIVAKDVRGQVALTTGSLPAGIYFLRAVGGNLDMTKTLSF